MKAAPKPLPDLIHEPDEPEEIGRCWWCAGSPEYRAYHDDEWGMPVADDQRLFEKLCLEGFQSGLSWITILRKREAFRSAFAGFDFARVAGFGTGEIEALLGNAGIIRHRGKIESTVNNARRALELIQEVGSLAAYLWRFEPDLRARPRPLTRSVLMQHTTSPESEAMSKDLKRRGWTFIGPTTAHAFMQAMGLVNDHVDGCVARARVEQARTRFRRPGA
jgi:DNA-3-methyladenine glycosylase I